MRFRITIILMLAIGGLTAIGGGTVLFISAAASIRNTLDLMRSQAQLTISLIELGVSEHVAPARELIADISSRVARSTLDIYDDAALSATLAGALAPSQQVSGVVVWKPDETGLWVTRLETGQIAIEKRLVRDSPGLEEFLDEVAEAKGIRWGEPFHNEGETFITITGVVQRGGAYGGVVAAGVSLVELSRFVRDLTGEDFNAFVLYGDDKVLAHSAMLEPDYASRLSQEKPLFSIDEIGDPVLEQFNDLPVANMSSEDDFELRDTGERGEGHIILSRSLNAYGPVPWQIGVHAAVEDVNDEIERLAGSILISLGIFVLSVAAALFLARRIARPIRAVSAAAGKIEKLELDDIEPLPPSYIRELDEQARSFNRMVSGLKWFQAYVPQTLVRRLMESTSGPAADVREAELTVMFTDIVGFTPLSESMAPVDVATMLNEHFELLNACIEAEGGTLDKFIGDATMAIWGAPESVPDHAARGCRTALAIRDAMAARQAAGATPSVRVKVGLHVGPLIVGNIGAPTRMNYTVIGDTVNVCSRIEALASEFDDGQAAVIVVSGDIVQAVGDAFRFEPLGERSVKGRAQPVEIWRLVGAKA